MKVSRYWKEIVSALTLILFVGVEFAYRQPAYDYSLEFIADWQDNATETKTNFLKFVSHFGSQELQAALVIIVYAFCSRKLTIKFLSVIFTGQVSNTYLKMFYHNPRPYYSSDEIVAMSCSRGYGNPSGHCLVTIATYGTLWVYLFLDKFDKSASIFRRRWQHEVTKWIFLVLIIALFVLTFISRMYLGSHSLNQTIYGTTLGIWIVFTFGFVLPPYIDSHYDTFIKEGELCGKFNLGFTIAVIVFFVLQIANIVLFYSLKDHNDFMNADWLKRIQTKCPKLSGVPLENSFKGTLHSTLYCFIYLSQIFCAGKFPKAFNYWYSNTGLLKLLLRTFIMVTLIGIGFIPYFVTLNGSFLTKMWIGLFLTNVIVGLIAVPTLDWITEKFKLISMTPREEKYEDRDTEKVSV